MSFTSSALAPDDDAGEGTNNDRLKEVGDAPAANNGSVSWGTNATNRRLLHKPGVNNVTTPQDPNPEGIASQDFGYTVLKTDMNVADARRYIPAGTWAFRVKVNYATADGLHNNYQVIANAYRRKADNTRELLFGTSSPTSAPAAINPTIFEWNKAGVPEIEFDTDETLQVEYWLRGRGGGATGLITQTGSFEIGPADATATGFSVPTGIRSIYEEHSVTVTAEHDVARALRARHSGDVAQEHDLTLDRVIQFFREFDVTQEHDLTRALGVSHFADPVQAHVLDVGRSLVLAREFDVTEAHDVTRALRARHGADVAQEHDVTFDRSLVLLREFDVTQEHDLVFSRIVIITKEFDVVQEHLVRGRVEVDFDEVPGGGGTTVVRRFYPTYGDE
ncbi:MAG: hypothetical protein ACRDH5_00515 [bacterium]